RSATSGSPDPAQQEPMNRRHFLRTAAVGLGAALAPAVARAQDPIKIGVLLPFSKSFAVLGENTYAGFMLGAKEAGPDIAGRKYTIVKEDEVADPSVGVRELSKLMDKAGVDV